jgi:2-C-methyl-D-erythritol 2,4-cyclodiphosphate synthase
MRVGFSHDIHKLVKGRPLVLGGVHIPYHLGEEAHSDGDVVMHALAEAILGALALGDLGTFYPPHDDKFLNIASSFFVIDVMKKMIKLGFVIGNVDISISLEQPHLAPYILEMREKIAALLNTSLTNVSVKAMTNEKLDSVGQGKAVAASCIVCLLSA